MTKHTQKTMEERFDEQFPYTKGFIGEQNFNEIKTFIRSEIQADREALKEKVEELKGEPFFHKDNDDNNCDCQNGDYYRAMKDILTLLEETRRQG